MTAKASPMAANAGEGAPHLALHIVESRLTTA